MEYTEEYDYALYNFDNDTNHCEKYSHEHLESWYLMMFVVWGVLWTLICFFGIAGNILSLIIIGKFDRKSVTLFLLKALAIADTIYLVDCVFCCFFNVFYFLDHLDFVFSFRQYTRIYVIFPIMRLFSDFTKWMTCLLALHRCVHLINGTGQLNSVLVMVPQWFL